MMAGGGTTTKKPGTTGTASGPFSWNGASTPSTFQPKDFGTQIFGDVKTAYGQGPQSTIPSFNPYSPQTSGLIQQGLGQVASNANSPLAQAASGQLLGGGNPYLNDAIKQANANTSADVNQTFSSNGRFGSDIHAEGLAQGLANNETNARFGQYNQDWSNMLGAQQQLAGNTANGLAYSGLLDSKNAEKIASDQQQQAQSDPFNYAAKYIGLLNGGGAQNTNQPTSLWDILGTGANIAGSILPFLL